MNKTISPCLDDFRLTLGRHELVPIMIGGMGVDISTASLALVAAKEGAVGHISDAMVPTVADRRFKTKFVKSKLKRYKSNVASLDKSEVVFLLDDVREATRLHVSRTMEAKQGDGLIFVNCMEKLTMNAPRETLQVRMQSALDAGVDGITLSAGLHLGSLALVADHPRFRDAFFGIIVSSARALNLFLRKNKNLNRLPDYVIVEGPLAGGHLGFGADDWQNYQLSDLTQEVIQFLKKAELDIPVIAAGGIFSGSEATEAVLDGAAGVQVSTRFTVTRECGLPDKIKQEYFRVDEDGIEVNTLSPTGYPMRMISSCPAIGAGIRPNCEAFGYLLDKGGHCAYIDAWEAQRNAAAPGTDERRLSVPDKTCLCTHMRNFDCWTCGALTWRLKDTTHRLDDGSYQLLDAKHVLDDYRFSRDNLIALPEREQ